MRLRKYILIVLAPLACSQVQAQWNIVAPKAVAPFNHDSFGGAIYYRDGTIWAGSANLIFSTDSGKTWNSTTWSQLSPSEIVTDIAFLDQDTGVVMSRGEGFRTTDRGQNWTKIIEYLYTSRVFYGQTLSAGLHIISTGEELNSFDDGRTWTSVPVGTETSLGGARASDGTLYMTSGYNNPVQEHVFKSIDSGQSWQETPGTFNFDSYSLDLDSCDASRMYIANEEYINRTPQGSNLLMSSNAGTSWTATLANASVYISGNLASSPHAIYAGTLTNGIPRSTDHGVTWKSIGGPSLPEDSHNICVINDNIIFAVDSTGNVWATFNSGGDSVEITNTLVISPKSLFTSDTVACDTLSQVVTVQSTACPPISVTGFHITGPDASSYQASSGNSIIVQFASTIPGAKHGSLLIQLSNGTTDTVSLNGYSNYRMDSIYPGALFMSDTVGCDSISRSLAIQASCVPSLSRIQIVGRDSSNYRITQSNPGSISVLLRPHSNGPQQGLLLVHMTNGVTDTVTLGGYSTYQPKSSLLFPDSLFAYHLLQCDSLTETIHFQSVGCPPPGVKRISLAGPDSLSYRLGVFAGDSLPVTMIPLTAGAKHGIVVFHLSDSTSDTILLAGSSARQPDSIALSPHSLFSKDTIYCDSIIRAVNFVHYGCNTPWIKECTFIGPDSASYRAGIVRPDSVPITLIPNRSGKKNAFLVLSMTNGKFDTIALGGYVSPQGTPTVGPSILFEIDTARCDSVTRNISIIGGCGSASVERIWIQGKDSSSYHLGSLSSDSIPVTLLPWKNGSHRSTLIIELANEVFDTIALQGYVDRPSSTISILPQVLFKNDTVMCDSISQIVHIIRSECSPLVTASYILGDTQAYQIGLFNSDSLLVTLRSSLNGKHKADLILTLSDGTLDTVVLAGYVAREPNIVTLSTHTLFTGDTARCDSITRSFTIRTSGCVPPSIQSMSIAGADSSSYLLSSTSDTISVTLLPTKTGKVSAPLVLSISDGSADTILLDGFCSNVGGNVSVMPRALFVSDTLRCDTITRSLVVHSSGCEPPILTGYSIIGSDSGSYSVGQPNLDTIPISFIAPSRGDHTASFVLTFSDGKRDTISLAGDNNSARTLALDTTAINLGTLAPCETRDTTIPYTNTSCGPVIFDAWRMEHYGDGFQVYNINYQPITIPAGETDSLHILFDGTHTGLVYDTVLIIVGTDNDSVRRIAVQTFVPAVDSVDFALHMPAQLDAGQHFSVDIFPDRTVSSAKGLTSVSGRLLFPDNDFTFDSTASEAGLQLHSVGPTVVNGVDQIIFSISNQTGISLESAVPVLQLWLESTLTKTISYSVQLDSLRLNNGDPQYSNCTLATNGSGVSAQFNAACGDSLMIGVLQGHEIVFATRPIPNPISGDESVAHFTLQGYVAGVAVIELSDVLGRTLSRETLSLNAGEIVPCSLDFRGAPAGSYFYTIRYLSSYGTTSRDGSILVLR